MADILNRLLLETKDFDAKLNNSKKSVNEYSGGVTNMAKTAGLGIGKLAGALGLAMGAGEAFNKVLNSSQTLGDMTARNMAALKTSVDEFFYSVGSGNLSSFINGLGGIIDKAKEAHGALDQLGNTQISHGVFSAANQTDISEGQYIAKNKFAPINERLSGFGMWGSAISSQKGANEALQRELINAATASVKSKITSDIDISLPDLMQAFETDLLNPSKRDETKTTAKRVYDAHIAYANAHTDDAEAVRKDAESRKKYLVIHAMLEKYNDTELKAIAAQVQQYYQTTTALNSLAREYNETATEFNNSNKAAKDFIPVQSLEGYKFYTGNSTAKGSTGSKQPTPPPVGSIADLDKQITDKNKELIEATTMQARIAVQTTINELEARKINLQIETDKGVFAAKHGNNKFDVSNSRKTFSQYTDIDKEISVKRKELISTTTEEARSAVQSTINELEAKKISLKVSLEKEISNSTIDKQSQKKVSEYIDIDNKIAEQRTTLISTTTEEARSAVQSTIDELEAKKIELSANIDIKSNMSSELAGVINDDTRNKEGEVTTKGAKGFDIKNIKSIKSPIKKKDINLLEEYQNGLYGVSDAMQLASGMMGENAASWLNWGASLLQSIATALPEIKKLIPALSAKAAAETAANNASMGPFGWIAAGAAVAGILGIFASIPTFSSGGVFEGGSTFGDMNLARVNAGEMILNGTQQGNLFRLLNSGSNSSANSSSSVENIHFSAEYKLRGADIYTSLTNYLKKTGKKI